MHGWPISPSWPCEATLGLERLFGLYSDHSVLWERLEMLEKLSVKILSQPIWENVSSNHAIWNHWLNAMQSQKMQCLGEGWEKAGRGRDSYRCDWWQRHDLPRRYTTTVLQRKQLKFSLFCYLSGRCAVLDSNMTYRRWRRMRLCVHGVMFNAVLSAAATDDVERCVPCRRTYRERVRNKRVAGRLRTREGRAANARTASVCLERVLLRRNRWTRQWIP